MQLHAGRQLPDCEEICSAPTQLNDYLVDLWGRQRCIVIAWMQPVAVAIPVQSIRYNSLVRPYLETSLKSRNTKTGKLSLQHKTKNSIKLQELELKI